MKAFLKRTWRYFIFIPIIAVVVIGIFLNLPKTEKTLALTASDLKVAVGEKVEVSYEVNIPEANCDFSIEDKNVALVDKGKVLGVSEGQTLLTIKKFILTLHYKPIIKKNYKHLLFFYYLLMK